MAGGLRSLLPPHLNSQLTSAFLQRNVTAAADSFGYKIFSSLVTVCSRV